MTVTWTLASGFQRNVPSASNHRFRTAMGTLLSTLASTCPHCPHSPSLGNQWSSSMTSSSLRNNSCSKEKSHWLSCLWTRGLTSGLTTLEAPFTRKSISSLILIRIKWVKLTKWCTRLISTMISHFMRWAYLICQRYGIWYRRRHIFSRLGTLDMDKDLLKF